VIAAPIDEFGVSLSIEVVNGPSVDSTATIGMVRIPARAGRDIAVAQWQRRSPGHEHAQLAELARRLATWIARPNAD